MLDAPSSESFPSHLSLRVPHRDLHLPTRRQLLSVPLRTEVKMLLPLLKVASKLRVPSYQEDPLDEAGREDNPVDEILSAHVFTRLHHSKALGL